jgi:hypothetical protein
LFDFGTLSPACNVLSIFPRCHPFTTHLLRHVGVLAAIRN